MGEAIRLDKLLADTGLWSRKEAKELLRQGRVRVDDTVERSAACKVDPASQTVEADGRPVAWTQHRYLMLNKPEGVLSATEDRTQKTVLDLLPGAYAGLFPVGRLDKDTCGLLLLTDDGDLAHQLLSPKHHVEKVYLAQIAGTADDADVTAFAEGMILRDGTRCLPAHLEPLEPGWCRVTLEEGKYHQVKRMLAARGKPVQALRRLSMGSICLDEGLLPGAFRPLTEAELAALKKT